MGQAYTPGLKVSKYTLIEKQRILPIKGKILVEQGTKVKPGDKVASAELPGSVVIERIAQKLGVPANELPKFLKVREGDSVTTGQVLAESSSFFGLFSNKVKCPIDGIVESISPVTGQSVLRMNPVPIDMLAYIGGTIKEVLPEEGVIIETKGSLIQGIFGLGGERMGHLKMLVDSPDKAAPISALDASCKGMIVVAGNYIDFSFINKAMEAGVKGIITAGIDDADIKALLGYEIGVAITGNEHIPLSIVATEGFGKINMAERTFALLTELNGKFASLNGATQIRAGVIRPEVIVTDIETESAVKEDEYFLQEGKMVRIIRNPWFGKLAKVVKLHSELQKLETEAHVRIVEVQLSDGTNVNVPRANVELIAE